MSARIRWVRGGLANFRQPIRISNSFRVDCGISGPNGGYWPPEIVSIFGVIKGDHVIGKTQVKQGKQPGILRRRQTARLRQRLRDLVPIVLNGAIPEAPGQRLIGRRGRAVADSKGFDLVECNRRTHRSPAWGEGPDETDWHAPAQRASRATNS